MTRQQKEDSDWDFITALWFRTIKKQDLSTGLLRLLICSHCSINHLFHTAFFARVLHCAHVFTWSLTPELLGKRMLRCPSTVGKNQVILRHLIIPFPTSLRESKRENVHKQSMQGRASEWVSGASEQTREWSTSNDSWLFWTTVQLSPWDSKPTLERSLLFIIWFLRFHLTPSVSAPSVSRPPSDTGILAYYLLFIWMYLSCTSSLSVPCVSCYTRSS